MAWSRGIMNRSAKMAVVICCLLVLMSCSEKKNTAVTDNPKVGMVLSVGGLGDKSFNDSAYRGLKKAEEELSVDINLGQPAKMSEDKKYLSSFASMGCDLVIGVGFLMGASITDAAKLYPGTKFVIIDTVCEGENIKSLIFKEEEGSFLVGVIAALKTKTKHIGFVGGMKVPLIKKFELGYIQGARYIDPEIKVEITYAGSGQEAFHDPTKGELLADTLFSKGADIVFHAAGSTGNGVIKSAEKNKKFAIGVDSNQNYLAPGYVLTSMIKRVDTAVYFSIKELKDGEFRPGPVALGLAEDAVGYALDEYNKDLLDAGIIEKVEQIKRDIISGKIRINLEGADED